MIKYYHPIIEVDYPSKETLIIFPLISKKFISNKEDVSHLDAISIVSKFLDKIEKFKCNSEDIEKILKSPINSIDVEKFTNIVNCLKIMLNIVKDKNFFIFSCFSHFFHLLNEFHNEPLKFKVILIDSEKINKFIEEKKKFGHNIIDFSGKCI